jgi:hypothetical protein
MVLSSAIRIGALPDKEFVGDKRQVGNVSGCASGLEKRLTAFRD